MQLTAKSFKFAYPDYASDADKAEFEQKINQVLAYLCQSETAQKILQQAAKSGVTIKLFDEDNNNYYCRKDFERERGEACLKHGQPHTVLWNPKISYIIENPVDGIKGELSPAMIFLHEMVHAIDDKEMFVHMDEMIFNTYFKTAQAKLDKISKELLAGNFTTSMENAPERLWEWEAKNASTTPQKAKEITLQLLMNALKYIKIEKVEYDLENVKIGQTNTGRNYVIIPTKSIVSGQGKKVELNQKSLVFEDKNKWYIVNINERNKHILKELYSDFKDVNID